MYKDLQIRSAAGVCALLHVTESSLSVGNKESQRRLGQGEFPCRLPANSLKCVTCIKINGYALELVFVLHCM